ncbi:MAG TPA: hypothetical protein VF507_04225, partial [Pyrinomonadaceae bacterium]
MKRFLAPCLFAVITLAFGAGANAQAAGQDAAQPGAQAATSRVVGEVTAVDAAAKQLTVKTDAGKSVVISTDAKTALLRLPPGATTSDKAARITLGEIGVGDKLFARGALSADGGSIAARQLVVTSQSAAAQQAPPGLIGRITAVSAGKNEITVESRTRDDSRQVLVTPASGARFLRYAPDSFNSADATQVALTDLKVGDQIRARGEMSADKT